VLSEPPIWWAFVLSCAAVVIALATLVTVAVQMRMTSAQFRAARAPAVPERKPDLALRFADGTKEFVTASYRCRITLTLSVTNDGDKPATNFRVRMFFPIATRAATERRHVGEDEYLVCTRFFGGPEHRLYPGDAVEFDVPDVACAESFAFLWIIDDDDGRYPSVGFGKLRVRVEQRQAQPLPHAGDEAVTADATQLEPGERLLKNYVEQCISGTSFDREPVQKLPAATSGTGFGTSAVQVFATDLALYGLRTDGERQLRLLERSQGLRRVITGATHRAYAVIDVDRSGHLFVVESISR
jgi:hypothetical protein